MALSLRHARRPGALNAEPLLPHVVGPAELLPSLRTGRALGPPLAGVAALVPAYCVSVARGMSAFTLLDGQVLTFPCPRQPGHECAAGPQAWKWNGDVERPSLQPSIRCVGGWGWHGYITDGVLETLVD